MTLTFIAPDGSPHISLTRTVARDVCRIEVTGTGIGVTSEDQARPCTASIQPHGVQEYPEISVGLAAVRQAVEPTGKRVGVTSVPGEGSTFWIKFSTTEEDKDEESTADR